MLTKLPQTIKETQVGLAKKEFSAVELVDAYLERIAKLNPDLNAFITVSSEKAYRDAKRVDQSALDLPLSGAVIAYKDLFLTEGIRTTAGSNLLKTYVPAYSATAVKRLEAAGAICIGKTNCDAWAHGASGENSDFGPTKNPWNQDFVPGGSSSGSAVAVSAGLSLIATGTDTGGSIRQPASFCNVVGFKPTYGAVSRYGVISMASSLDSVGHFTRTVEDARKVFEVTKGADGRDSTISENYAKGKTSGFKVGIPKEFFIRGLDSEVEKQVREAIAVLEKEGIEFKEISLPLTKYAIDVYYIIQPAEVSSNLGRYDGIRYGNDRETFGPEAVRRIMLGTYVLSSGYYDAYYLKAMQVRSKIIAELDRAFEEVDALIGPVSPTPPFRLGEKADDPLAMYLSDILTVSANIAGLPGIALPAGFTKRGLPVGLQILGPRFSEETLFNLGSVYQQKTDWHLAEPKL